MLAYLYYHFHIVSVLHCAVLQCTLFFTECVDNRIMESTVLITVLLS